MSGPDESSAPSVEEALRRARDHARNALSEGLEAARALLDAAALASAGVPAAQHPTFGAMEGWLAGASRTVASGRPADTALTQALAEALDAEIERWEQRAARDDDARAVLRAFLGVRELLWELGVRRATSAPDGEAPEPEPRPTKRGGRRVRRRVERVPVEGRGPRA